MQRRRRYALAWHHTHRHLTLMCGRVIQSSGPIRYAIVEGIDLPDNRVHNYPPSLLRRTRQSPHRESKKNARFLAA
jgi:hypothetical protein